MSRLAIWLWALGQGAVLGTFAGVRFPLESCAIGTDDCTMSFNWFAFAVVFAVNLVLFFGVVRFIRRYETNPGE